MYIYIYICIYIYIYMLSITEGTKGVPRNGGRR